MLDVLRHDNSRAVLKGPASSQALKSVQMERMKGGKTGEDSHWRFLTGMPDDDLLQRPIVA
jgi:hypothetical protein